MSDLFKRALSLGLGATVVSKEKVEKAVNDLVKRGELAPSESRALVDRLMDRGAEEQNQMKDWMRGQIQKMLTELDIPTKETVEQLQQRITVLEKRLAEQEQQQPPLL
ncbi:phasin family protein [Paenibacillus wulumuqiensis]|uniref:phasin family protein n=1 Tax=Paenibacillus wulumuqiensis TaxID=1567107 RepID=UPI0006199E47|nr:ATP synthase subunit B [Paenibacillus wulumuqiensis]